MIEKWKWVPKYEKLYSISNHGRVYSYRGKGRFLKIPVDSSGYYQVVLQNKGRKTYLVHRLVLKLFEKYYLKMEKLEVNHKDGDKLNNRIDNLEWATRSDNAHHAYHVLDKWKNNRNNLGQFK